MPYLLQAASRPTAAAAARGLHALYRVVKLQASRRLLPHRKQFFALAAELLLRLQPLQQRYVEGLLRELGQRPPEQAATWLCSPWLGRRLAVLPPARPPPCCAPPGQAAPSPRPIPLARLPLVLVLSLALTPSPPCRYLHLPADPKPNLWAGRCLAAEQRRGGRRRRARGRPRAVQAAATAPGLRYAPQRPSNQPGEPTPDEPATHTRAGLAVDRMAAAAQQPGAVRRPVCARRGDPDP